MNVLLKRYSYAASEVEGLLVWGHDDEPLHVLWTLEQPWVDYYEASPGYPCPSGRPSHSCIPEGIYQMEPFTRPDGQTTWVLVNPDLGVFAQAEDRDNEQQRYLCLLHKGNFVQHTEGCILPGLSRALLSNADTGQHERAVASSAAAMNELRNSLGELSEGHTLEIIQERGAIYGGE